MKGGTGYLMIQGPQADSEWEDCGLGLIFRAVSLLICKWWPALRQDVHILQSLALFMVPSVSWSRTEAQSHPAKLPAHKAISLPQILWGREGHDGTHKRGSQLFLTLKSKWGQMWGGHVCRYLMSHMCSTRRHVRINNCFLVPHG